ncbi:RNA-binding S4 domain-containing protein [Lysinibacillus sp. UGB7]|uniref:RNA-binding S4 domain-containing protein n=1 Tax=Lysinibacillus sp. UGB7 TaxID=3411039 RepID=UPI003B7CFA21
MYPFYVNGKKVFSFSYKPQKGDVIKYDETGQWFEVTAVENGRGRKVYGRYTIEPNWRFGY